MAIYATVSYKHTYELYLIVDGFGHLQQHQKLEVHRTWPPSGVEI